MKNLRTILLASALTSACGGTNTLETTNQKYLEEIAETNKGQVTQAVQNLQARVADQTFISTECDEVDAALICDAPAREDISNVLDLIPYDLSAGFLFGPNTFNREGRIAYVSQPGGIATNVEFQKTLWANRIPSQTEKTQNGISFIRIGHKEQDLANYALDIAFIAANDQCLIGRNNGNLLAVKCK